MARSAPPRRVPSAWATSPAFAAGNKARCHRPSPLLRFPYRIESLFSVASRAPAFLGCSTRRVAASDVVRVHRMLPDRRAFEPCCPVLRRYFGEAASLSLITIEAGLIDGRAKIKIEVSP
jgi:hypothetical protein